MISLCSEWSDCSYKGNNIFMCNVSQLQNKDSLLNITKRVVTAKEYLRVDPNNSERGGRNTCQLYRCFLFHWEFFNSSRKFYKKGNLPSDLPLNWPLVPKYNVVTLGWDLNCLVKPGYIDTPMVLLIVTTYLRCTLDTVYLQSQSWIILELGNKGNWIQPRLKLF